MLLESPVVALGMRVRGMRGLLGYRKCFFSWMLAAQGRLVIKLYYGNCSFLPVQFISTQKYSFRWM